ncbi:MAG: type 4a pilus biogenesis protein PilO [Candidatus Aminicenantes bacterium]|nr:type 4a pilus biogenesis protein PilO [Candidatus Aminicenantes bacterium]
MKRLPWYGFLILALIIAALAHFLYFKPKNEELAALTQQRVTVEEEVNNLRAKKKELDSIEAELVTLRRQLAELTQIIPEKREQSDILRRLQQLAYDSRLDISRFEQRAEVNRDFYVEWPINLVTNGNFHNLGTFFDRLSRFSRLFLVPNFTLKALNRQSDTNTISATWTAQTYIFLEEGKELPPPPTKKKTTPAVKRPTGAKVRG